MTSPLKNEVVAANESTVEASSVSSTKYLPNNRAPTGNLLGALLRLCALRKANADAISGSDGSIAALIVVALGIWIAVDRIAAGSNAEFYFDNVPTLALIGLGILMLAWFLARRSSPPLAFRRVLVVVLGLVCVVVVVGAIASAYVAPQWSYFVSVALLLYGLTYFVRALGALTGTRQTRAAALGTIVVVVAWVLTSSLNLDASVWYEPDESDSADSLQATREQAELLLFDQREKIDEAIEKIGATIGATTERPANAKPATFFVGFAGVGEQRVFAEEIELAAKVVGNRYHTGNRSLLLINDRRDLESHPLASVTGLHYALRRLAEKMDVEHDILFLGLSSHGSDEPALLVSNSALPLNELTGNELASALDDSGIKWRVIVVSACHAGAFIKPLSNPNTVIITAAAADKTSFGCSDDRDLTYFGEAFYRDALPKSTSLVDAFNETKTAIRAREKVADMTASDPQAFFGDAFRNAFRNY